MVRSLLATDLVDELLLTIEPIILGGRKTIFAENGRAMFSCAGVDSQSQQGAKVCRYARAR
jgi:riboflavin biosynthesis pyrimidine reductase